MIKKILVTIFTILMVTSCSSQSKMSLIYVGSSYTGTMNDSFMNNELVFLQKKDTLKINIKIPFDVNNKKIINDGVYYNCHLQKDKLYIITFKKICLNNIPKPYNSYYNINATFSQTDCSVFKEFKLNTPYQHFGRYGKYVDMNNTLYEIIDLTPPDDCVLPH